MRRPARSAPASAPIPTPTPVPHASAPWSARWTPGGLWRREKVFIEDLTGRVVAQLDAEFHEEEQVAANLAVLSHAPALYAHALSVSEIDERLVNLLPEHDCRLLLKTVARQARSVTAQIEALALLDDTSGELREGDPEESAIV